MAELLFSTMGSKGRFKPLGNSKFKVSLKGVDSRLTWFTDRPDREAGSVSFDDLISQWDNAFAGNDPNSALIFKDESGNRDTVVFEQSKPRYNEKKEKLTFKIKVHDQQKLDSITGALYDEAQDADGSFTQTFSDFSLFVDNWISKDTSVNFINDTDTPIRLVRLKYSTDPNWKSITENALKAGVQWNYGYDQKDLDMANPPKNFDRSTVKNSGGKYVISTFKESAKTAIINAAVSVGTDLVFPTAKSSPSYLEDDIIFINPGESYRITDVETNFGIQNGVRDVGVIAGRLGEYPADFAALAFDNPMVGSPKGYIRPLAVKIDKAVTSTEQVYVPEGPKVSSFNLLNGVDRLSIEYFGDIDVSGTSAKGWDVHFQNL
jgi:hypothetical protein